MVVGQHCTSPHQPRGRSSIMKNAATKRSSQHLPHGPLLPLGSHDSRSAFFCTWGLQDLLVRESFMTLARWSNQEGARLSQVWGRTWAASASPSSSEWLKLIRGLVWPPTKEERCPPLPMKSGPLLKWKTADTKWAWGHLAHLLHCTNETQKASKQDLPKVIKWLLGDVEK